MEAEVQEKWKQQMCCDCRNFLTRPPVDSDLFFFFPSLCQKTFVPELMFTERVRLRVTFSWLLYIQGEAAPITHYKSYKVNMQDLF